MINPIAARYLMPEGADAEQKAAVLEHRNAAYVDAMHEMWAALSESRAIADLLQHGVVPPPDLVAHFVDVLAGKASTASSLLEFQTREREHRRGARFTVPPGTSATCPRCHQHVTAPSEHPVTIDALMAQAADHRCH